MLGDATGPVTKENTARTRCCKGKSGALADRPCLLSSHGCHDVDREPVSGGHVADHELNPGQFEARKKVGVPRQPIEAGDDKGRTMHPTEGESAVEFRSITDAPAFHLGDLVQDVPSFSKKAAHRLSLRLHAEATDALLLR